MPANMSSEEMAARARFIFRGTVEKLGAATPDMKDIPVNNRTAVVKVDQIIQAPDMFTDYAGWSITVQLAGSGKVKVGQQLVFYTNGWLYGENIAVQSIGQVPVTAGAGLMAMGAEDPVKRHEDQIMKEQVDKADLIVTGTVTTVRLPDEQAPGNMLAPAGAGGGEAAEPAAAPSLPRSEHDPMWREAVINIASKEKGDHAQNEVVVRFPGSRDIAWYQAPKFIPGQQGVFFLHKQQLGGGAEGIAAMGAGGEEGVYAVLQSADFQPIDKLADIQAMAAQPPGPDNG